MRARIQRVAGRMNGMEAEYAVQLEARKRAGAIVAYWYEAQTMKLAHDTRYTPDFLVQLPNGEMELHEVKGFWREDAKIKAKVCASLYPYPVYIAQRMRGGGFTVQLVEA